MTDMQEGVETTLGSEEVQEASGIDVDGTDKPAFAKGKAPAARSKIKLVQDPLGLPMYVKESYKTVRDRIHAAGSHIEVTLVGGKKIYLNVQRIEVLEEA